MTARKATRPQIAWGGGITATYDDAIKFADNFLGESVDKMFDKQDGSPVSLLMRMYGASHESKTLVETIAFCYGKTDDEVRDDIMRYASRRTRDER